MIGSFVSFYRHSSTDGWWQSPTRKAFLAAMVAVAPFLGGRFHEPHVETPGISTPYVPGDDESDGETDNDKI
jgi:hypothetical protein